MHNSRLFIKALALIIFIFNLTAVAEAQSPRTFVSGFGDDFNPCSRTAPCKSFAAAFAQAAVNGEINCLDPAGYGAVTITKSITIDCEDTQGSTLASNVTGITVNLGALNAGTDPQRTVRVRGISINGAGSQGPVGTRTGIRGIHVVSSNTDPVAVIVEQVIIDNFINDGIFFEAAGGELIVRNSLVQNCGANGVRTTKSGTSPFVIHATLDSSTFVHNVRGVLAETSTYMTASNCNMSNNSADGAFAQVLPAAPTAPSELNLYNCVIANNGQVGVVAAGNAAIARLDGNYIVNNQAVGVKNIFAQVYSRGNNTINGSPTDVDGAIGSLPNR
jgi:hypothetical protein